jgi:hypothetical protein
LARQSAVSGDLRDPDGDEDVCNVLKDFALGSLKSCDCRLLGLKLRNQFVLNRFLPLDGLNDLLPPNLHFRMAGLPLGEPRQPERH